MSKHNNKQDNNNTGNIQSADPAAQRGELCRQNTSALVSWILRVLSVHELTGRSKNTVFFTTLFWLSTIMIIIIVINPVNLVQVRFFMLAPNILVHSCIIVLCNKSSIAGDQVFWFLADVIFTSWPRSGELRMQKYKLPSGENTGCKRSPFKAWSRSVYSHTCYAYFQGFLPCLFLPFRSIYLHFFQNLSRFLLCWLWLTHGSCVGPQNNIGHPAGCRFPCWAPAEYK